MHEDLPASLLDVAETFGLGVAISLMQHFGGQEVSFSTGKANAELTAIFGAELAAEISFFLSGKEIYIPHGRSKSKRLQVDKLLKDGRERREIARRLGISQRHVRRLAAKPPPQMPLFPDDMLPPD